MRVCHQSMSHPCGLSFYPSTLKYLNIFMLSLHFLSFFLKFVLIFKNMNFNLIIFRNNENKTLENQAVLILDRDGKPLGNWLF